MRSPAEHAGRTTKSPCPARKAGHQRWCPGFSRQAWLADRRFVLDTILRTDTDTSPLSAMRSPSGACGSDYQIPMPRAVNAGHQRWCPGFSRQAWLADRRFVLDTDSKDRHGYIAFEPLCGAPAEHAGRNRRIPMPARKRWTPALVSRLQPPSLVARVPIRVGHGCCGRTRIHRP